MVKHFVVDNSVVMSWCFKDETNKYADTVLDRLTESAAVVPSIWPLDYQAMTHHIWILQ
jgi:hypothetical protein